MEDGGVVVVELRGIEPLTSAVRLLAMLHLRPLYEEKVQQIIGSNTPALRFCDTSAIPDQMRRCGSGT
jgi:hypothetical protein